MFKFAIVVAALAVSATLAVNVPQQSGKPTTGSHQEPSVTPTAKPVIHRKRQNNNKPVLYAEASVGQPSNGGGMGMMAGLMGSGGVSGLLEMIASPKKLLEKVCNFIVAQLKALTLKRVLKIALVGALVTVLGAVAAVSVAGLVSLVSGLCAAWPYMQMFIGGGGGGDGGGMAALMAGILGGSSSGDNGANGAGEISDEQMDMVTEFVLGAMDKYEKQH